MEERDRVRRDKGTGSFRKKGKKIEYRITYKDEFGRVCSKSFTADTKNICLDRADLFYEKLEKKMAGMDPDITIAEILKAKVQNDLNKNYTGVQGYDRNMATIKIIEKHGIGNMPIAEVEGVHIDDFLTYITKYANTTISKLYAMLKRAYKMAMEDGVITKNYMEMRDFRCPVSSKKDKVVRGLSEDEQKLFVKTLMEHKPSYRRNTYKLQLLIELYSGLRMGEINALRPEDINFKRGYIHVCRTISRGRKEEYFLKETPKTAAGVRDVPISRRLEEVLRQAIKEMKNNPEGLIFYDYNKNDMIRTHQVNSFYARICAKAGIENNGQHSLRHTFASRCIEAGIPAIVLKNWMGHTDIHITLDTYADVFSRMNLGSVEKLDRYIDSLDDEEE